MKECPTEGLAYLWNKLCPLGICLWLPLRNVHRRYLFLTNVVEAQGFESKSRFLSWNLLGWEEWDTSSGTCQRHFSGHLDGDAWACQPGRLFLPLPREGCQATQTDTPVANTSLHLPGDQEGGEWGGATSTHTRKRKGGVCRNFPSARATWFPSQALTIKEIGKQNFPESISPGLHPECGVVTVIRANGMSRARVVLFVFKDTKYVG